MKSLLTLLMTLFVLAAEISQPTPAVALPRGANARTANARTANARTANPHATTRPRGKLSRLLPSKKMVKGLIATGLLAASMVATDLPLPARSSVSLQATQTSSIQLKKASAALKHIKARGTISTFKGKGGVELSYASLPAKGASKGALVIVPGLTEPWAKYLEVVWDLRNEGYDIFLLDHRGQGLSQRLLPDAQKSYVQNFADYSDDLHTFVTTVVAKNGKAKPKKTVMLAHSMGGAIATRYAQRFSAHVDQLILSAPMHEVNTGQFPPAVARAISWTASNVGLSRNIAPGPGEPRITTQSKPHQKLVADIKAQNPTLEVADVTFGQVEALLAGSQRIRDAPQKLKTPTVVLQAGADTFVGNKGQDQVCAAAAQCKLVRFEGSAHEILNERPHIRQKALQLIRAVLAQ
jgi:lysophospholipase